MTETKNDTHFNAPDEHKFLENSFKCLTNLTCLNLFPVYCYR